MIRYRAVKNDCDGCDLNGRCCPTRRAWKVTRSVHGVTRGIARDIGGSDAHMTSFIQRRKIEMLLADLKSYIGVSMMRLQEPNGAIEEIQLVTTARNFRKRVR